MLNSLTVSAETLQTRRERQYIFKVLTGKNLQPRLLYPERISFQTDREIKSFSDQQKLREFSTTKQLYNNVKWTSIVKKYNRRKKIYKINPKQLENFNRNIYINNYFKRKWIKCSNQKKQTSLMDTKTRLKYMLSTRNPLRPKDTYRLKVRGWKNIFHANGRQKKGGVAVLQTKQTLKKFTRDKNTT